ncbi:MAG: 23S rRNA (pseudouridine(1915)-N(3))-methyltransferase RlmH [Clostridia bacterium]|nr:23S rRNA (pseudouridine(1915)-N(3))-methyltransferase RlmH [Clostridia bacterium]
MNITVITVGKLKEKYLKSAQDEYLKRLSRFAKVEVLELPDEKIPDNASDKEKEIILKKEGEKILSQIKDNAPVVAMCIEGELVTSEELSKKIDSAQMQSGKMYFVIGGSLGLSGEVKKRATHKISFGRITLPHQLIRITLLEQIYRSFKIINNETYHK